MSSPTASHGTPQRIPVVGPGTGDHPGVAPGHRPGGRQPVDLDRRPILVFWESTRACLLACAHCRAEAQRDAVPGELTTAEAERFVDSLAAFGTPAPVLVITGGDVLMRRDLDRLVARARTIGLHVALAPSVTPLLTDERMAELRRLGVKVVSISIDGSTSATHDAMRGIAGHLVASVATIERLRSYGYTVQINTTVTPANVEELPAIAELLVRTGAAIWEVFFLVNVGRGAAMAELGPDEHEDVCQFLVDASHHGFVVRTVEGPMFRRIVRWREAGVSGPVGGLYERLSAELLERLGAPTAPSRAQARGTRDGRGIVFVSSTGDITPAGFLPLVVGNVRTDDIAAVYRDHPTFRRLRGAELTGPCGRCDHRELCGGSRSRAYAATGDPFASDPACALASQL